MLQIKDIRKQYITGELVQTALDGVSLNLRDHEFVAILGPSGSGKTTLLNVIGGLDRYDSGDLIINGISTKKYSDRDWDSYRNHTIGFVFQSYNLIPHQSVLANVELALTISGISPSERKIRAKKALEDVGLGNQLHKKPNQMSGGQMQRVAIARALVNDPDILLADEPTGALDSETSVQVMDLLQEVSRDRLVVMVTHNPELAEEYASRIVRVKDGRIIDDSDPFDVNEDVLSAPKHKNMGKSSMSFLTALALSFNNLRTKLARTLLTAFAGSIGIIGIALIMSLSTGFQKYIDKIQEDTLSNYPLTLQTETADMTAALAAFGSSVAQTHRLPEGVVGEQQMISAMFSQVGKNDLASFKTHLEANFDSISHTITSVKYSYGIRPLIFSAEPDVIFQVNPATLFSSIMGNPAMSAYMDSNVFYEMIDNYTLLESQYNVLQGRWPEKYNEMVFVLQDASSITDYMAYALGMKDPAGLEETIMKAMQGQTVDFIGEAMQWSYEDLLELKFKLVDASGLYRYNQEYGVWEDMSSDETYMRQLLDGAEELSIVGIVCPREGVSATTLTPGIGYTAELTQYVIRKAKDSPLVLAQLGDRQTNVFTGKEFGAQQTENQLQFENMISVDGEAISSAFGMNISMDYLMTILGDYVSNAVSSLDWDTEPARKDFMATVRDMCNEMLLDYVTANADPEGYAKLYLEDLESIVDTYLPGSGSGRIAALAQAYHMDAQTLTPVFRPLLVGYLNTAILSRSSASSASAMTTEPTEAPTEPTEAPTEPVTEPTQPATETTEPATESTIPIPEETEPDDDKLHPDYTFPSIDPPEVDLLSTRINAAMVERLTAAYLENPIVTGVSGAMAATLSQGTIYEALVQKMSGIGDILAGYIGASFYVDEEKLASAFQFNLTEEELMRLMNAMSSRSQQVTADTNLSQLGYADVGSPSSISIYMVDFEKKEEFIAFLEAYNDAMRNNGSEERVISYTDLTGIMMSSVRTIIDSVSYALIAFVAVSLVVSSIMIGIITYISVMERTKEIGVLRAIGASKRNISQVFNAETFIIGLCSGLLGIGITLLLLIPGNYVIHTLTNNPDIVAQLPWENALALILLSMVLTLIGGFIPARQAAKKDPVIALRSE